MLVDYERVLLDLKRHLNSKPHHGQRELAVVIAELETKHEIEEGLAERALRLYGMEFYSEVIASSPPTSREGCDPAADGDQDHAPRGDSHDESEEDIDGNHPRSRRESDGQHAAAARRRRNAASGRRSAAATAA